MGLAQPRRRTKIANDPRNLAWTTDTDSYGQRLMQQQGWKSGEALGAKGRGSRYADTEAAKVHVQYKDDTLGLGASLKSKDVAHQRTGFDAFQGLLGRLNAKSEDEVKVIEKKLEDKKLAVFAQGRWGGMVFVPGGTLIQNDTFKLKLELDRKKQEEAKKAQEAQASNRESSSGLTQDETADKLRRKEEKRLRKELKRARKEEKRSQKASKMVAEGTVDLGLPTPDMSSANETESTEKTKRKRTPEGSPAEPAIKAIATQPQMRNGRHILRGKNIMAKRAAFSDMKGLDEIFMRNG